MNLTVIQVLIHIDVMSLMKRKTDILMRKEKKEKREKKHKTREVESSETDYSIDKSADCYKQINNDDDKCNCKCKCRGEPGLDGSKGPCGSIGSKGDEGTTKTFLTLFSAYPVNSNDYIGIGSASNKIEQNSAIIPTDCTISSVSFSIKKLSNNISHTAYIYVNGSDSGITVVIADGSLTVSNSKSVNISLLQNDLITGHVVFKNGTLPEGVSITLLIKI